MTKRTKRIYVKVPYSKKDEAKAQGAKWDPMRKKWWFPSDFEDLDVIQRWGGRVPKTIVETNESPTIDSTVCGWFDGGSRGNPGICGYGALLRDTSGKILKTASGSSQHGTNNEAEHQGCVAVLTLVYDELRSMASGPLSAEVRGDSKLVIQQALGEWECKVEHLAGYVKEEQELIQKISEITCNEFNMVHVPREENTNADALANFAMDQIDS